VAALAERFKVYAVDLWGFGYSSRAPMAYGYELYAKQVLLFMDALQLPRASFIGQSLGAGIAMMIAARHPGRVSQLVLAAPAGLPNPLPLSAQLFCLPLVGEWLANLPTNRVRRWLYERYLFHDAAAVTEAHFDAATRFQKIRGTTEASLSILRRRFFDSLSSVMPQLAQQHIPTLIVWGREDRSISVDRGVKLHALLPHARLEILDGAGHAVNVEAADQFNRLVGEFLSP
jgi:pimeloyl-ACP methyl ester carboxylesterase